MNAKKSGRSPDVLHLSGRLVFLAGGWLWIRSFCSGKCYECAGDGGDSFLLD